jgi:hypothetical protein
MFYPIVVMLPGAAGVAERVYVYVFYLTAKFLFQGLGDKEVVAKDDAVVEHVFLPAQCLAWQLFEGSSGRMRNSSRGGFLYRSNILSFTFFYPENTILTFDTDI